MVLLLSHGRAGIYMATLNVAYRSDSSAIKLATSRDLLFAHAFEPRSTCAAAAALTRKLVEARWTISVEACRFVQLGGRWWGAEV